MKTKILDVHSTLKGSVGDLAIHRQQEIPDSYLQRLAEDRDDKGRAKRSEFYRVASIPVAVVEKWMREGFDVFKAPGKEIIKKLRTENLDAFITGNI